MGLSGGAIAAIGVRAAALAEARIGALAGGPIRAGVAALAEGIIGGRGSLLF